MSKRAHAQCRWGRCAAHARVPAIAQVAPRAPTYPRRVLSGHLTAPLPRPVTCPPDFHSRCISESAAMVPTAYGVTSCIPASLSQFLTSRPLRRRGQDCLVGAGAAGVGPWDPVPASSQRPGALAWPLCGGRMLRFPSVHAAPPAPTARLPPLWMVWVRGCPGHCETQSQSLLPGAPGRLPGRRGTRAET